MADYIYLLQNRLSAAQQTALQSIRDVAKTHGLTMFLVGGAVRDLTSGSPVRDLDVAVQGNALKLKKDVEATGAVLTGEVAAGQVFFARFPGGVRVEIGSTLSVTYPKPGKPVAQPATILDDLRRRDFTANAMALSLNEGSYGLLMDPLNGVADIENRQLRLVSNYGFIEDPVRMIRAARFGARLGWSMDEKTQARYDTGKQEKYIAALSAVPRGYEAEEIFHEEDPLRVLRRLEEEGWMKHLFPAMTVAKANAPELERLREVQTQLQMAGINPDAAAANFPLLTAKLSAPEVAELKKLFVRQGFVREIEGLDAQAKEFAAQLSGKGATLPSQAWKLIHAATPEAVLSVSFGSKSPTIQAKLKSFHTEWPKARQKVPFVLMQEMRIVPELETFNDIVEKIFFELMDGNLSTPEEQKAFLEPFSPPAPPPPVRLGRSRAGKKDGKGAKGKKKIAALIDDEEETDRDLDEDEIVLPPDDENESAPVIAELETEIESDTDADTVADDQEIVAPSAPEPETEVEPAAVVMPEAAPSAPPVAAVKPKRTKAAPAPKPPVVEAIPVPQVKAKPTPAKKTPGAVAVPAPEPPKAAKAKPAAPPAKAAKAAPPPPARKPAPSAPAKSVSRGKVSPPLAKAAGGALATKSAKVTAAKSTPPAKAATPPATSKKRR